MNYLVDHSGKTHQKTLCPVSHILNTVPYSLVLCFSLLGIENYAACVRKERVLFVNVEFNI